MKKRKVFQFMLLLFVFAAILFVLAYQFNGKIAGYAVNERTEETYALSTQDMHIDIIKYEVKENEIIILYNIQNLKKIVRPVIVRITLSDANESWMWQYEQEIVTSPQSSMQYRAKMERPNHSLNNIKIHAQALDYGGVVLAEQTISKNRTLLTGFLLQTGNQQLIKEISIILLSLLVLFGVVTLLHKHKKKMTTSTKSLLKDKLIHLKLASTLCLDNNV